MQLLTLAWKKFHDHDDTRRLPYIYCRVLSIFRSFFSFHRYLVSLCPWEKLTAGWFLPSTWRKRNKCRVDICFHTNGIRIMTKLKGKKCTFKVRNKKYNAGMLLSMWIYINTWSKYHYCKCGYRCQYYQNKFVLLVSFNLLVFCQLKHANVSQFLEIWMVCGVLGDW